MDDETTQRTRTPAHSEAHTTPSSHLAYSQFSLTPKEKERVDLADAPFNQRRCLIENYPNNHSVQYCHMIARKHAQNEVLMSSLEWHWNMSYGTLHLNTRYNIFFAGASLRLLHDNDAWGLLPDENTINRYLPMLIQLSGIDFADRGKFPDIQLPEEGFEYRLIPLGNSMKQYRILWQNDHAQPPNKDQYTLHFYPFDTLPPLRSHLHPKFAIFELGRKYNELIHKTPAAAAAVVLLHPSIKHVYRLYVAWTLIMTGRCGLEAWQGQGGTDGDRDRHSETSTRTGCDSLRKGTNKRRRTGNDHDPGSPTPAGKKSGVMRMGDLSCENLSYSTLVEHERVCGKGGWTQKSLSDWAVDASKQVPEARPTAISP